MASRFSTRTTCTSTALPPACDDHFTVFVHSSSRLCSLLLLRSTWSCAHHNDPPRNSWLFTFCSFSRALVRTLTGICVALIHASVFLCAIVLVDFFPPRAHLRSDCRRSKRVYHYPRTWPPYQVLFSTFLHSCHFLLLFRSPSVQVDLARLRMGPCLCPWPYRPVEVLSAARATPRACFVFPVACPPVILPHSDAVPTLV